MGGLCRNIEGFVAADDGFQGYASRCDNIKLQPLASLVNTTWLNTGPCFLVFQCWLISSVRGKATEWGVAGRDMGDMHHDQIDCISASRRKTQETHRWLTVSKGKTWTARNRA